MGAFRLHVAFAIGLWALSGARGAADEPCASMVGSKYAAEELPSAMTLGDVATYQAGMPGGQRLYVRGALPTQAASQACAPEGVAPGPALGPESPLIYGPASAPYGVAPYGAMPYGLAPYAAMDPEAVMFTPTHSAAAVLWGTQAVLPPEELLPAPNSANDVFYPLIDPAETRLGQGWSPLATMALRGDPGEAKDLWSRLKVLPSFGLAYDTGVFATDVQTIKLGDDPAAGQTTFTGSGELKDVPLEMVFDTQMKSVPFFGLDQQVQFLVAADNYADPESLKLGHLYGRFWDLERITLGAGKTFSLFSVGGVLPATLSQNTSLIGSGHLVKDKPAQVRLQLQSPLEGGWGGGVALEDPYRDDFKITGTKLTRWPTLAGNVVYRGRNEVDRVQFSSLVRSLGFQDAVGAEHFETAWGLSAYALYSTYLSKERVDGVFAGVAGGEGIGQYIHGVSTSATFDGTSLESIEGLGAYIGYKQQWITAGNREFGSNLAYGYAAMETPATLAAEDNRQLHQAWANLLYFPSKNVAVGVEYQHGSRETRVGAHGENHRFMFVLALTTTDPKPAGGEYLTKYGNSASYAAERVEGASETTGTASRQSL